MANSPALNPTPEQQANMRTMEDRLAADARTFGTREVTAEEHEKEMAVLHAAGRIHFISSAEHYAKSPATADESDWDRRRLAANDRIIALAKIISGS